MSQIMTLHIASDMSSVFRNIYLCPLSLAASSQQLVHYTQTSVILSRRQWRSVGPETAAPGASPRNVFWEGRKIPSEKMQ